MCVLSSSKPKIEKVAPAPQAVTNTETDDRAAAQAEAMKKRRGYASTRVAEDRNTLLTNAGGRQTLG